MKTARATIFAILFACLCTSAAAQVVKCKGPGGKVIYSDVPCPDGAAGQSVNTQANVLDASGERFQSARSKGLEQAAADEQEVNMLMQSPPKECRFKHFALSDSKGKVLADNAKRECVQNMVAERRGGQTNDRHYRLWREHYDSERNARNQAVTRSAIQSQQLQNQQLQNQQFQNNNNRTYTCNPNGIGGLNCR